MDCGGVNRLNTKGLLDPTPTPTPTYPTRPLLEQVLNRKAFAFVFLFLLCMANWQSCATHLFVEVLNTATVGLLCAFWFLPPSKYCSFFSQFPNLSKEEWGGHITHLSDNRTTGLLLLFLELVFFFF